MEHSIEKPYKIIIVGGLKSGKTSFFRRWIYDEFLSSQHHVLGIDFALKRMVDPAGIEGNFLIKLWDIQGAGDVTNKRTSYKGAQGVVICYDLAVVKKSRDANPSLQQALQIKRNLDLESEKRDWPKPPCILVGCKSDLTEYNLNAAQMDALIHEYNFVAWFETSSRGALNLQKAMERLVREIFEREAKNPIPSPRKHSYRNIYTIPNCSFLDVDSGKIFKDISVTFAVQPTRQNIPQVSVVLEKDTFRILMGQVIEVMQDNETSNRIFIRDRRGHSALLQAENREKLLEDLRLLECDNQAIAIDIAPATAIDHWANFLTYYLKQWELYAKRTGGAVPDHGALKTDVLEQIQSAHESGILRRLDLQGTQNFDRISCHIIATSLLWYPYINELNLTGTVLKQNTLKDLLRCCVNNIFLFVLRLNRCGITSASVKTIAQFLKDNSTLAVLALADNEIDTSGFKVIMQQLELSKNIVEVDLSNNKTDNEICDPLVSLILRNTSMNKLAIATPFSITPQAYSRIITSLMSNFYLVSFDLGDHINLRQCKNINLITARNARNKTYVSDIDCIQNSTCFPLLPLEAMEQSHTNAMRKLDQRHSVEFDEKTIRRLDSWNDVTGHAVRLVISKTDITFLKSSTFSSSTVACMSTDTCKVLQFATNPIRFGIVNYEQSNLFLFTCATHEVIPLLLVLNQVLPREDVANAAMSQFGEIEHYYIINQMIVEAGMFNRYKAFVGSEKVSMMVFRENLVTVMDTEWSVDVAGEMVETFKKHVSRRYDHPNISFKGFCTKPLSLIFEYPLHGSLQQVLGNTVILKEWNMKLTIAQEIASALNYLHQQDIVFGYLNSAMVMVYSLNPNDEVHIKLTDCGAAKLVNAEAQAGRSVAIWTAPEMLGKTGFTKEADVFSFGMILWQLVARQRPHSSRLLSKASPTIPLNSEVSSHYVKLMDDCLSEDPQARPTFANIISSGCLSPEEMNISLDNLMPPQDWGEPFAHGSTASIYRARVRNSRSTIAVKRLNVPLNNATSMIMNQRITCLTDNRHPNLTKYYGCYFSPLTSLIFMEYLPVGDLYSVIHNEQKKAFVAWDAQGRSIAKNIADGLAFLHSLDPPLVHFDLKSKNILLGSNLVAKIADLDSARAQPNTQLSVHSSTKKTLQWTAPELFRGKHVSKKVDVYSLSIVIWEILTQKIPWDGMIEFEVMGKLFNGQRPDIPPNASSHVRQMLEMGWANNPDQRLSALDIAHAMQEEIIRHARTLSRDASHPALLEAGSLPTPELQEEVITGRIRAPSTPVPRTQGRPEVVIPVSEPAHMLRRKGVFAMPESPNSLSPRAMRRTRSIENFPDAVFTTVTLTPPMQPRSHKRTESCTVSGLRSRSEVTSRAHRQMRLDSRSEVRSDSRSEGRSESRSSQGESRSSSRGENRSSSRNELRPPSRGETNEIERSDSRGENRRSESRGENRRSDSRGENRRSDSRTENRNEVGQAESTSDGESKAASKTQQIREDPQMETAIAERGKPPARVLKRADSNPNVGNLMRDRTLKRAESNPNMNNLRNTLLHRSTGLEPPRSDSRSETRSDSVLARRFSFTRSSSGIGLRYEIAPKDEDTNPTNNTNSINNNTNNTNNNNENNAALYNKEGYNTGEIHREQITQFNENYLDEEIENVTPQPTPPDTPPLPPSPLSLSHTLPLLSSPSLPPLSSPYTLNLSSISENEQYENTTGGTDSESEREDKREQGESEEEYYDDEEEEEEEDSYGDEGIEEEEEDEDGARDSRISYEVNAGDENGDDDYEEKEKEKQKEYLAVKSDPDDNNDNGSSSFVAFRSLKYYK